MRDHVVGIAILDKTEFPEELLIRCRRANGEEFDSCIPVYEKGKPKVRTHQWQYTVVGDTLHITPSVNMFGQGWHNEANWSVRFVQFDQARFETPRDQLRIFNEPRLPRLHD